MGATFGAVHVKGARLADVVDAITGELEAKGFVRLGGGVPESDGERRIAVFEDGGWTVVADEELTLDEDRGRALGRDLSVRFDTDAIAITVFHSDTAVLARFHKGDGRGRFQVPDDGEVDEETGHRRVKTKFLADLARDANAKEQLRAGLLGDHTFPEQTVARAAALIGLPHPGAGAAYSWNDPNVTKLRFALPERERAALAAPALDWRPPELAAHAIHVAAPPEVRTCVGMPLYEHVTVQVQAYAGDALEGLTVELSGSALALLDVPELAGWNPDIAPGRETRIFVVKLDDRGRARFPKAILAPAPPPALSATSAAALRAWKAALADQSSKMFVFHLRGKPRKEGSGEVAIRILDGDGRVLDTSEARIAFDVAAAPRVPILPSSAVAHAVLSGAEPHGARSMLTAAQAYSGEAWLCGWIGFDAPLAEHEAFLLESASTLASCIAAGRGGELEISITSAGTHPKVKKTFRTGDRLRDFGVLTKHLAREADVKVHVPYTDLGPDAGAYARLRHQPNGTTIFDEETRAMLARHGRQPRVVPLDVSFAVQRPKTDAACAELAAAVDAIVTEAAKLATCIGGFVTPMGRPLGEQGTPYEDLVGVRDYDDVDAVTKRPRSPGWRVILPGRRIVESAAESPFAMTPAEREAVEREVAAHFA